jgi:transposase
LAARAGIDPRRCEYQSSWLVFDALLSRLSVLIRQNINKKTIQILRGRDKLERMRTKHTYFPRSTAGQRKLLFETWEATGSVSQACERAHLSRVTFYHWKSRFDQDGYAGLEQPRSHRPKTLAHKKSAEIEAAVISMRKAHPDWGKQRIAHEMAKRHNWVPLVSLNTVRRILRDAGLWREPDGQKKKKRNQQPAERSMGDRP